MVRVYKRTTLYPPHCLNSSWSLCWFISLFLLLYLSLLINCVITYYICCWVSVSPHCWNLYFGLVHWYIPKTHKSTPCKVIAQNIFIKSVEWIKLSTLVLYLILSLSHFYLVNSIPMDISPMDSWMTHFLIKTRIPLLFLYYILGTAFCNPLHFYIFSHFIFLIFYHPPYPFAYPIYEFYIMAPVILFPHVTP